MLCYKDRTFCPKFIWKKCKNANSCDRVLTSEVKEKAKEVDLPICCFSKPPPCFQKIKK